MGQLTNDTLFAVLGPPESVRRWFETSLLFDVECNAVNEEVLLREASVTVSRGWDGDELQLRAMGAPEKWRDVLSREAAELGHVLEFR